MAADEECEADKISTNTQHSSIKSYLPFQKPQQINLVTWQELQHSSKRKKKRIRGRRGSLTVGEI